MQKSIPYFVTQRAGRLNPQSIIASRSIFLLPPQHTSQFNQICTKSTPWLYPTSFCHLISKTIPVIPTKTISQSCSHLSKTAPTSSLPFCNQTRSMSRFTPDEEKAFREIERWGQSFQQSHIPRNQLDFSFARSSGPGGQNVNKVSSKAQIKFLLSNADWIHPKVIEKIKQDHSRYLSANMNEFTITSEVHRIQEGNVEECIKKICELVKQCCVVPKETSEEQKQKVSKMIQAQKRKDIEFKKRLKEKKQDRRG